MIRINAARIIDIVFAGATSLVVQSADVGAGQTVDVVPEMNIRYAVLTVDGAGDVQVVYRVYVNGSPYAEFTAGDIVIDSYANVRIQITATNTDTANTRRSANLKLTYV